MAIRQFDSRVTAMLGQRIERALADLGQELGVRFAYRGCCYGSATSEFRIEAAVPDRVEARSDRSRRAFDLLAPAYGLEPSDYGRQFDHPVHGRCVLSGLMDRAKPQPVVFRRMRDDQTIRVDPAAMRAYLGKPNATSPSVILNGRSLRRAPRCSRIAS